MSVPTKMSFVRALPARATRALASASRTRSVVARAAVVPVQRVLAAPRYRAFTSTAIRRGDGESDGALQSALGSEHAYEVDAASAEGSGEPEFLQEFRSQGVWRIQGKDGSDDVVLERSFGSESLKLSFQISDLADSAVEAAGADAATGEPVEVDADVGPESTFLPCHLLITKPGKSDKGLSVDLSAAEDGFTITNVALFDKEIAEREGVEGDWKRRELYLGPEFDHLDVSVQESFDAFLAERGVDDSLAAFIPQYCEYKEQKDYVNWLDEVNNFIKA